MDETYLIDHRIGKKQLGDILGKFGLKTSQIKPIISTLPIEHTGSIDFKKLYEEQCNEKL